MYHLDMDESRDIPLPTNFSIKLPGDVAALLRRLAYETGRSKRDLVLDAVRKVYAVPPVPDDPLHNPCQAAIVGGRAETPGGQGLREAGPIGTREKVREEGGRAEEKEEREEIRGEGEKEKE